MGFILGLAFGFVLGIAFASKCFNTILADASITELVKLRKDCREESDATLSEIAERLTQE